MTLAAGRPSAGALGALLVVVAACCFATLGPISRFAADAGVGPLALVTWRAAVGATVVTLFLVAGHAAGVATVGLRSLPVRDRWFLAAAAAANTVLNLSVFVAFGRLSIALVLLVFYTYPALVAVASVAWFGERMDRLRWTALGISLAGLACVISSGAAIGTLDPLGIALATLGALGQVFYVMAARYGFARVPGPQAAALTMAGAAVLYVAMGVLIGGLPALAAPLGRPDAAVLALTAGIVGAGIPTVCFITGIRRLGAPRAAILATLEPVVGVGLAALLLGERPAELQLVGGALIILAAVLLQVRPTAAAEHEAVAAAEARNDTTMDAGRSIAGHGSAAAQTTVSETRTTRPP